jgi:hypothetical protein
MRERGEDVKEPSDPFNDRQFVALLARVYDIGTPGNVPPDADERSIAA